jgi:hypothetical protein
MQDFIRSCSLLPKQTCLSVYRGTASEFLLGDKLRLKVHACAPDFLNFGSKSGSRSCFLDLQIPHPEGTYVAEKNLNQLIQEILQVCRKHPQAQKGIIKLDEGFAGKGNAVIDLSQLSHFLTTHELNQLSVDSAIALQHIKQALETAEFMSKKEDWQSFSQQIKSIGAIFELFVTPVDTLENSENKTKMTSPSVQVCIDDHGNVDILSSHEQILQGQFYVGKCFFL